MQPLPFRLTAILVFLFMTLHLLRKDGPAPREDGPVSATRAMAWLDRSAISDAPHPTGSPQAQVVADELTAALRDLGFSVEAKDSMHCESDDKTLTCAALTNLIATKPGASPSAGPLMVLAHYDSVAAGPGVSDDGAALAVIVEVLRDLPTLSHPLMVVITEGEEMGLLGAKSFLQQYEGPEPHGVINLEARGTSGPSMLFQTSPNNQALMSAFLGEASWPETSSVAYEVYKRLPNDTDLTPVLERGWTGINFAYIEGVENYHTPRDDLAHLSPNSLQHHGDNLRAAIIGLDSADTLQAGGDLTYWSVFGLFVLSWPSAVGPVLAALACGLWLWTFYRAKISISRGVKSVLLLVFGLALGVGLSILLAMGAESINDTTLSPFPLRLLFITAPITLFWTLKRVFVSEADQGEPALVGAIGLVWAALALGLTVLIPGLSVLFLPAALAAGLLSALRPTAYLGSLGLSALHLMIWIPLAWTLEHAMGMSALSPAVFVYALAAIPFLLMTTPAVPKGPLIPLALAVTSALAAAFLPAPHAEPKNVRARYTLTDSGTAQPSDEVTLPSLSLASTQASGGFLPFALERSQPTLYTHLSLPCEPELSPRFAGLPLPRAVEEASCAHNLLLIGDRTVDTPLMLPEASKEATVTIRATFSGLPREIEPGSDPIGLGHRTTLLWQTSAPTPPELQSSTP